MSQTTTGVGTKITGNTYTAAEFNAVNGAVNANAADALSQGETSDQEISSNLGVGRTVESDLRTSLQAVMIGQSGGIWNRTDSPILNIASNFYQDTSNDNRRVVDGFVSRIQANSNAGTVSIDTAATGLAGSTVSFVSGLLIDDSGTVSLPQYGAGDAQFLSGGVLSSVSDSKYKTQTRDFVYGGAEINAIADMMGFYKFNDKSPHSGDNTEYASFYADKIATVMEEAAPLNTRYVKDSEGNDTEEIEETWHSLNTRPIIMALVKAHKDQSDQIATLIERIEALES